MGVSKLVTLGFNTGSTEFSFFRLTTFGYHASLWLDQVKQTTIWTDI